MTRKGSRKVRTGCVTCKIRRVKCDEAKPSCNRCTTSGRHCDGYTPINSSELQHYRPYRVFPGASQPGEGRALQYFVQEAAPYLAGAIDPHFWPKVVMQFTSFESAVRHSVVSISCLAERIQRRAAADEQLRLQDETFALQHYNAAIHELRRMPLQHSQPVVLLVCLLFVYVELMQANRRAAMVHCKHGFQLMRHFVADYPWTREHLLPLFKRASSVAFVHGDDPRAFPDLRGLEHPTPAGFTTMNDAQLMIDDALIRVLRLVRRGDVHRRQPEKHMPVPPELLAEQASLGGLLDTWRCLYDDYQTRPSPPEGKPSQRVKSSTDILSFVLATRHETCRIWLNTAFGGGGYDYTKHLEAYKTCFARIGIGSGQAEKLFAGDVYFVVDIGYLPSISMIMTKCYPLESRLRSLGLMPLPGLSRENISPSDKGKRSKTQPSKLVHHTADGLGHLNLGDLGVEE
ncbi:hypothetical protein LX36DRAFT_749754 [Colletotrichum falcatum]|nr:hypothetical protein LX36DRAFT_749754 [Colletotrichum falcatum]